MKTPNKLKKLYTNSSGRIAKMADIPMYGKNPF